ncbi:hypothetical protein N8987_07385 [Crocinitomix sp.]|nr:hypothetical protein [Crocinitomix sp.]
MNLNFLDSLVKRVAFSFAISCFVVLVSYLIYGERAINLMTISIIALLVYVPVTFFYAIASTFFKSDDSDIDDDILDAN